MNSLRIALHGCSGSGKSAVCNYLRDNHNLEVASTGHLCRKVSRILFNSEDRHHLNEIGAAMRTISIDIWVDAALRNLKSERIVFDSVRYPSDIARLRTEGFLIWTIFCPADIAEKRLISRGQRFEKSDLKHESELSLIGIKFDFTIDNGERPWNKVCEDIDKAVEKSCG